MTGNFIPAGIDFHGVAVEQPECRVALKLIDDRANRAGQVAVVRTLNRHDLAANSRKALVDRFDDAAISLRGPFQFSDPLIGLQDRNGLVRRPSIDHHDLQRAVILREDRVDRGSNILSLFVAGHNDRDQRTLGQHSQWNVYQRCHFGQAHVCGRGEH